MKNADIVIVGGGMVGLALAALLKDSPCQIKIIENREPHFDLTQISHRVSAINTRSQRMLEKVGVWQTLPQDRLSPYYKMAVKEKDSFANIEFDLNEPMIRTLGLSQLGFIIENQQIQYHLWQQVRQQTNTEILIAQPQKWGISDTNAVISLTNGEMISAKLVIGADGANSWVRQQAQIPLVSQDYQHTALVCNVKTAEPHQQTARQIFAPESILAFLPLHDPYSCSIVWSLPPLEAQRFVACETKAFNQALTIAFDNQLGLCELQSERAIYPLTARYARDFAQPRLALIGDAAHTIHPLAGLGVNLGFADAIALADTLNHLLEEGKDIGEYRHLRSFERQRKVEALRTLSAMGGLKALFAGDNPLKKLLRGVGLSLTNQLPPIKKLLIEQATGIPSQPKL